LWERKNDGSNPLSPKKTKIKKEVKKMAISPSLTCLTLQFGDLFGELGKLAIKLTGLIPE
jgi:hypothetical protein